MHHELSGGEPRGRGRAHRRIAARARTAAPLLAALAVLGTAGLATAGCGVDDGGLGHVYGGTGPFPASAAGDGPTSMPPGSIASQDFTPPPPGASPDGSASENVPPASYALRAKLLKMPATARPWPAAEVGAFGLQGFISRFYVAASQTREKRVARERGFAGAARTGWFNQDGTQAGVFLVGFSADSGARQMYESITLGWSQSQSLTTFADGDVRGEGAVSTTTDKLGNIDVRIAFYTGSTFGEVHYWAPAADQADARAAALAQYRLLAS